MIGDERMLRADMIRKRTVRPAMLALLVLVAAFFITLVLGELLLRQINMNTSVYVFGIAYGVVAAVLAWMIKMARWWKYIVGIFPIAVISVSQLNLPPSLFFAIFVVLLLLYWTTFKSQVPFYPSNKEVWDEVGKLIAQKDHCRLIDIGSGFGGGILYWAKQFPDKRFEGVEIAPLPWFVSKLRAQFTHNSGIFLRQDYLQLDFKKYDIVFAYLSPAAMDTLWDKAKSEMRSGSLLISYEFIVEGQQPDVIIPVASGKKNVYGWFM